MEFLYYALWKFIQIKQVDKVAPFHDPLKKLKLKTLASDCVIKKDVTTKPLRVTYVTSFNKHSYLRNLVNH